MSQVASKNGSSPLKVELNRPFPRQMNKVASVSKNQNATAWNVFI